MKSSENNAQQDKVLKIKQKIKNTSAPKKVWMCAVLACAVMVLVAMALTLVKSIQPYAIVVDGNETCYLPSKEDASKVLETIFENNKMDGAETKAYEISVPVEVEVATGKTSADELNVVQAADYLQNTYFPQNGVDIFVSCVCNEQEEYTPEPDYRKDEKMMAGESKVKRKAKKGTKDLQVMYTLINGEKYDKEIVSETIITEGTPAIIYKGVLGLPDGEDWKTYTGDPVFKDGEELTKTALTYLGLKYKYGGNSLTDGVDCVTFVWNMYKKFGIDLKCSHAGLQSAGKEVSLKDAKKGDIVCYYGHVAIYLGDGKIVHASRGKGVCVSDNVNYKKIKTIRRVVKTED